MSNPSKYLSQLVALRVQRMLEHPIEKFLWTMIAAVLSGVESWNEIEGNRKAKRSRRKNLLKLHGGFPSHKPCIRVIFGLDPADLEQGLAVSASSIAVEPTMSDSGISSGAGVQSRLAKKEEAGILR